MTNPDTSPTPLPEHLRKKKRKPASSPESKSVDFLAKDPSEEAPQKKLVERFNLKKLSSTLTSFIVHVILILILAVIYIPGTGDGRFSLFLETEYADESFDQTFELSRDEEFVPEVDAEAFESSSAESLESFEPELVKIESSAPAPVNSISEPGLPLSGRNEASRQGFLKRFGGTPQTEDAVELGLKWLARNQKRDGSWSLKGPYRSLVAEENTMAATGLALLAFLGHGDTHKKGQYRKVVQEGLAYLIKNQTGSGHFVERRASLSHGLYSHAICSIAVCESLALTQDEKLIGPARNAIDFAAKAQGVPGGWKYEPGSPRSDLSVTGWYIMLFQSAKYAGIGYDPEILTRAEKFIDTVMVPDGSRFRYEPDHEPSLAMTAEGLLCRQYLGWKQNDPRLEAGARYLLNNPIRWSQKNVYYWYYATQVMKNMEDETWKKWNATLTEVLPKKQRKTGVDAGSWDHEGDPYGGKGGRLYATCLCIYCLEVYYRHMPIYRMK